jgi:xylan 1,4-beta-xylosidase
MKIHLFKALVVFFAVFGCGNTGNVRAESFGIKFLGSSTNDLISGSAGVVPISGWTNIDNSTFTNGTIWSSDGSIAAVLTRSGPGMAYEWHSGSTGDGGNGSLLDGYNDCMVNQPAVNVISNLIAPSYTVYLYTAGDNIHPASNTDYLPNYIVNGTIYYTATLKASGAFSGFVKGGIATTNTSAYPPGLTYGNYIEIDNVVPTDGTITIFAGSDNFTWRSPLDGIEIVATSTNQLHGTVIGTPGSWSNIGNTITNVFDTNWNTFFDGPDVTGDWVGLDFGAGVSNVIGQIRYWPRSGYTQRMQGGYFQGANTASFADAVTLFTITNVPPDGGVPSSQIVTNAAAFRYVRYVGPVNGSCNVAELQFFSPGPPVTPPRLTNNWNGSQLNLSWAGGYNLLESTNLTGPWNKNTNAITPFNITPSGLQKFYRTQSQPMFQNPLFGGDFPDVGILRVGGDFYVTQTSFAYGPGLVIWHSTDLVNWTPISSVFTNAPGSNEIWAPELVYSGGRYLVYFAWSGIHVCYANSPYGPWSAPINMNQNNIDPGFVAGPNGTNYLYFAGGNYVQLSADGLSTVGSQHSGYSGWNIPANWIIQCSCLEGPKFTQHGGYYYLIAAEGGTAGPPTSHMSVVARSTSPLGPWQNSPYNPLIHTYSGVEGWWSVGHATLFSTPDDHWYIVYHGYRKGFETLGRNTLMEPIEWTSDGWPRAPLGPRRDAPMSAPMGVAQAPMLALSDDFQASTLKMTWQAWMETDMTRYQVGGGTLVMRGQGSSYSQSLPLTVRARDISYQVQVGVSVDNQTAATLGLEYNPNVAVYLKLTNGTMTAYGPGGQLASISWAASNAWLKMVNLKNQVQLLVSPDGQQWQSLVSGFDASGFNNDNYGDFQAARPALSAIGSGNAYFSGFRYDPL